MKLAGVAATAATVAFSLLAAPQGQAQQPGQLTVPAASRPKVTIRVPAAVDQGKPMSVSYSMTRRRSSYRVYLQRTMGTSSRWIKVKALAGKNGTVRVNAPVMGRYQYRVVILNRHKRLKASSPSALMRSYGFVSLYQFLSADSVYVTNGPWNDQTANIGGKLFRHVTDKVGGDGEYAFHADKTTCRAIVLTMAQEPGNGPAQMAVVQENADSVFINVPENATTSSVIGLRPGAVELQKISNDEMETYINGQLSCYTPSGV